MRPANHRTFLWRDTGTDWQMIAKKQTAKQGKKNPIGDRIQFLTMMSPDTIRSIKNAALEEDRAAWAVMEEAATEWLERHRKAQSKT